MSNDVWLKRQKKLKILTRVNGKEIEAFNKTKNLIVFFFYKFYFIFNDFILQNYETNFRSLVLLGFKA